VAIGRRIPRHQTHHQEDRTHIEKQNARMTEFVALATAFAGSAASAAAIVTISAPK
jgi:hypothetical protein